MTTGGEEGLVRYWEALGREHGAETTRRFQAGGLEAVRDYWRDFFAGEPGAEVDVTLADDCVTVAVATCPAIEHLRAHGREIMPLYCRHCSVVSAAMCAPAGVSVLVTGGDGACTQIFRRDLSAAGEASV